MNIALAADSNFYKPLMVLLYSLYTSQTLPVNIFLFTENLNEKEISSIEEFCQKVSFKLNLIKFSEKIKKLLDLTILTTKKEILKKANLSVDVLYKLFTPYYIKEEKFLWLDADCIIKKDLSIFYNQDLQNYVCAACDQGCWKIESLEDYPFLKKNKPSYFNAGVVLVNNKKLKEIFSEISNDENLFHIIHLLDTFDVFNSPCFEQDFLNTIIPPSLIKWCDPLRYNFFVNQQWDHGLRNKNTFEEHPIQYKIMEECYILHYSSKEKPWNKPLKLPYEKAKYFLHLEEQLEQFMRLPN